MSRTPLRRRLWSRLDRTTNLRRAHRGRIPLVVAAALALTGGLAPASHAAVHPPGHQNGLIAFNSNDSSNDDDPFQVWVMRPDGNGLRQVTHLPHNSALRPNISRDGRSIVFSRGTPTSGDPLFTIDVNGTHLRQVTHDPANNFEDAYFSPTAQRIAATRFPTDGSTLPQVVVMNADGSDLTQITHDPTMVSGAAKWSPDGQHLAICSGPADFSRVAVFTIRPDGSDRHRVTPWRLDGCDPSWAPDSRHLVFASNGFQVHFGLLYIVDTWTGQLTKLTHLPANFAGLGDFDPAWSPQGDRIAFASDRTGCCDIWVVHLDGDGLVDLTPGNPPYDAVTSWSANSW